MDAGFREKLRSEFDARRRANHRYSLRAFSRRLGMDASHLSKVLGGKRPATRPMVRTVGERLGWDTETILCLMERPEISRNTSGRRLASQENSMVTISIDAAGAAEAQRRLAEFRAELLRFLRNSGKGERVYRLRLSLSEKEEG